MRTMRELKVSSLLLFASFFIISTADLDPERFTFNPSDCSPDEEFLRCGSVCAPTCESIFIPDDRQICTKQCVIGCFCRRGLVRDKSGRCLPREACRKPDDGRHFSQEKIDDTGDGRRPDSQPSRQPDGRSLYAPIKPERPSYSPTTCRADEEYKHCGSVCDDTCSTVFATELRPCTLQCVSGCFCKPPLVRDLGEACVPANQCSNLTSAYAPQGSPDSLTEGRGGRKLPPQSPDGRDGRRPDSRYPKQYPLQPDVKDGGRYPSRPSGSEGVFGQRFRPQPDGRDMRYPSQQPDGRDGQPFRPQPDSRDGRDGRGLPPQSPDGKDNRFRPQPDGRDGRYPSQPDSRDGRYPSRPDSRDGRYPSQPDTRDGRYPSQPDTRDGRQFPQRPDGKGGRQYPSQQPEGRDGRHSQPDSSAYIRPERSVSNPRDCRRDENYQTCGSACDDTCTNIYDGGSRACTYQCVIGCYCNKPLVRAADGSCVRAENCRTQNATAREGRSGQQPQYPKQPQYPQYPQYPQQPQSPQDPQYPQRPQYPQYPQYPQSPQQPSQYPSQTKEPFPKRPDGNFSSAPPGAYPPPLDTQCGPNEIFLTCGTSCEDTCETIFETRPRACTYQCVMGCFCTQGLVRDRNGNCVTTNQCPTPPQYSAKGGSSLPRDAIIHSPSISVSPNSANRLNTAIESGRRAQNANECREDEVFNTCGSRCADNCQNVFEEGPKFCTYECVIGCFCRPPLVRSADGSCISREQCPALQRRPRSYYQAGSNPLPAALRQASLQPGCRNDGFETSTTQK